MVKYRIADFIGVQYIDYKYNPTLPSLATANFKQPSLRPCLQRRNSPGTALAAGLRTPGTAPHSPF
jgi:hypothetical protein